MKIPDIRKSIATGRVRESGRFQTIASTYFPSFISIGVVILIGLFPYIYTSNNEDFYIITQYWMGGNLVIAFLMILRMLSFGRLRRISGYSLSKNKERLKVISEELKWPVIKDHQDYSILFIKRTTTSWAREVIIIYDGSDLLVNITTYAKFHRQSLQGYFGEKRALNKLERRFSQTIDS